MPTPPPIARFFGQSALYAASGAIVRAGNFMLLPVYWRYMTPSEFGILAITEIVSMGLLGVLTLCLEGALVRFFHEWPEGERRRRLGALWVASLFGTVVLSGLAFAAAFL